MPVAMNVFGGADGTSSKAMPTWVLPGVWLGNIADAPFQSLKPSSLLSISRFVARLLGRPRAFDVEWRICDSSFTSFEEIADIRGTR